MFRSRLKLVAVVLVSLVALTGCFGGSTKKSADVAAVSELYDLVLWDTEDITSVLEHIADPLTLIEIVDGEEDLDSVTLTHDDLLEDWAGGSPFNVPDKEDLARINVSKLVVRINGDTATTIQTFSDTIPYASGMPILIDVTMTLTTTWSKASGDWLLASVSSAFVFECAAGCDFLE